MVCGLRSLGSLRNLGNSRADLEQRRVTDDPNALEDDQQVEVEDLGPESESEEQDQRNPLDPGDLARQITVRRPRPTHIPVIPVQDESGLENSEAPETSGEEESTSCLSNQQAYGGI